MCESSLREGAAIKPAGHLLILLIMCFYLAGCTFSLTDYYAFTGAYYYNMKDSEGRDVYLRVEVPLEYNPEKTPQVSAIYDVGSGEKLSGSKFNYYLSRIYVPAVTSDTPGRVKPDFYVDPLIGSDSDIATRPKS